MKMGREREEKQTLDCRILQTLRKGRFLRSPRRFHESMAQRFLARSSAEAQKTPGGPDVVTVRVDIRRPQSRALLFKLTFSMSGVSVSRATKGLGAACCMSWNEKS